MKKIKIIFHNVVLAILIIVSLYFILHILLYIYNYYQENDILFHYPANHYDESHSLIKSRANYLKPNEVGDSIGGILNPLVGLCAVLVTFLAFYIQFRANDEVRKQFRIQQFENQYFEMIRLHKENINEMKIKGYNFLISRTVQQSGGVTTTSETREQVERDVEDRKVFVSMIKELEACFKICLLVCKDNSVNKSSIHQLAYRVFFFGSNVALSSSQFIDEKKLSELKNVFKKIREEHKNAWGEKTKFVVRSTTVELPIKYAPFTGHESRLGHYYRHLFATVKFVTENETEDVYDFSYAMRYLKILRIQMTNHEQTLLYYNYICGLGSAWENDHNKFFSRYRMLHNLPIDRAKFVENPRKHFSKIIDELRFKTKGKEQMFVWGDEGESTEEFLRR